MTLRTAPTLGKFIRSCVSWKIECYYRREHSLDHMPQDNSDTGKRREEFMYAVLYNIRAAVGVQSVAGIEHDHEIEPRETSGPHFGRCLQQDIYGHAWHVLRATEKLNFVTYAASARFHNKVGEPLTTCYVPFTEGQPTMHGLVGLYTEIVMATGHRPPCVPRLIVSSDLFRLADDLSQFVDRLF